MWSLQGGILQPNAASRGTVVSLGAKISHLKSKDIPIVITFIIFCFFIHTHMLIGFFKLSTQALLLEVPRESCAMPRVKLHPPHAVEMLSPLY